MITGKEFVKISPSATYLSIIAVTFLLLTTHSLERQYGISNDPDKEEIAACKQISSEAEPKLTDMFNGSTIGSPSSSNMLFPAASFRYAKAAFWGALILNVIVDVPLGMSQRSSPMPDSKKSG